MFVHRRPPGSRREERRLFRQFRLVGADPLMTELIHAKTHLELYLVTGRSVHLDHAIDGFSDAVYRVPSSVTRTAAHVDLGQAYWDRYMVRARAPDLEGAILHFERATKLAPDRRSELGFVSRSNLASVKLLRWDRFGHDDDLHDAIDLNRLLLADSSPYDPTRPATMHNLARGLLSLAHVMGDTGAIDEAVTLLTSAVQDQSPRDWFVILTSTFSPSEGLSSPPRDPRILSALSATLAAKFAFNGGVDQSLLDDAVHHAGDAVSSTLADPSSLRPDVADALVHLANAFRARALHSGRLDDLGWALLHGRHALDVAPTGSPVEAQAILVLVEVEHMFFVRGADSSGDGGRNGGLIRAVSRRRARRRWRKNVRRLERLVHSGSKIAADRLTTAELLRSAAATGLAGAQDARGVRSAVDQYRSMAHEPHLPMSLRIGACRTVAALCRSGRDLPGCLDALELAVSLVREQASPHLAVEDQLRWLARDGGELARRGAQVASELDDPVRALRVLEDGRGILLQHSIGTRVEVPGLAEADPILASRFHRALATLTRLNGNPESEDPTSHEWSGLAVERHRASSEWDQIVAEIRSLPGLDTFLRPPEIDALIAATGPRDTHGRRQVIEVNISDFGCAALIITAGACQMVPLQITSAEVEARYREFRDAVADLGALHATESAQATIQQTLEWMWTGIAKPVLDVLRPPPGSRVWWIPTGPLTNLPLHAAGNARESVHRRVISSYAPTLRSLVESWNANDQDDAGRESSRLVVALPDTPGHDDLPGAHSELDSIKRRTGPATVLTGAAANRENFLTEIRSHSHLHLASHVRASSASTGGVVVLHDHATAPLSVTDISRLRLDTAELAYLSACDTSLSPDGLSDEGVHVAGAFRSAGYRHVIGTSWAVGDTAASRVADAFYAAYAEHREASPATALHAALEAVREEHPEQPWIWASFVHVGP